MPYRDVRELFTMRKNKEFEKLSAESKAMVETFEKEMWKTIGQNVRKLREARGATQEGLAEMTGGRKHGISVRTIARVENGEPVSLETLKDLAATFDVDVEEFKAWAEMPGLNEIEAFHKQGRIVVVFKKLETAAGLVEMLNSTGAHVFHCQPPENTERADAVDAFASTLDDYRLIWGELTLKDKYEAQQCLQRLMNDLERMGYTFYAANRTYAFGCVDQYPKTGTRIKTVFISARRLNRAEFLGELPRSIGL
jgi:transcriptional regulator with XRE-family HTH domain